MADEVQLAALQQDSPAVAEGSTAAVQNAVKAPDNIVTIIEDRLNNLIRAVVVAATAQQEEPEPSVDSMILQTNWIIICLSCRTQVRLWPRLS